MLRQFIFLTAFALVALQGLNAQSLELFGGYSVNRMKPDNFSHATMTGWNSSITTYPTSRFGLTGDFAGWYGSVIPTITDSTGATASLTSVNVRQYSFMGGPQFRLLRRERFETSFKTLFGAAHGYVSDPVSVPVGATYRALDQTSFAALFGSNLDFNISKRVALRFSPGMYLTQFGGETQRNFRFSVGPVFRFGEH
jgi:hypothetical protein